MGLGDTNLIIGRTFVHDDFRNRCRFHATMVLDASLDANIHEFYVFPRLVAK